MINDSLTKVLFKKQGFWLQVCKCPKVGFSVRRPPTEDMHAHTALKFLKKITDSNKLFSIIKKFFSGISYLFVILRMSYIDFYNNFVEIQLYKEPPVLWMKPSQINPLSNYSVENALIWHFWPQNIWKRVKLLAL